MARRIEIQVTGDVRGAQRSFRDLERSGLSLGRSMSVSAGTVAKLTGAFVAIKAARSSFDPIIGGASDLAESASKARVVFGKAAAEILAFSRTSAAALGLTRQASLEAAGSFGQLFETAGLTERKAARFSKTMVELAADIASFNNLDVGDSLDKLRSGLAGEAEPLRAVGVLLSEARVQQEAYASGIAKVGSKLTEQQKVQARYALILKDTARQQGDFARTAGGLANAQRIASAQFKDIAASVGGLFVPALARGLTSFNRFVDRLRNARGLRARIDIVIDSAAGVARKLFQQVREAVGRIDWSGVWSRAQGLADGLQQRLEQIDFGKVGTRIGNAIADAVRVAVPKAKELAARISDAVAEIDFAALGKKLGPGLATALVTAFTTLTDPAFWVKNWDLALAVAATVFGKGIGKFAAKIGGRLLAPLAKVGANIALAIAGAVERFSPRIGQALLTFLLKLPSLVGKALAPLFAVVRRVFDRLGRVGRFVVKVLGIQAAINAVVDLAKKIAGVFTGLGRTVEGLFTRLWESLRRKALRAALAIVEPFSHLPAFLGGWARDAKNAIKAELDGTVAAARATANSIQTVFATTTITLPKIDDSVFAASLESAVTRAKAAGKQVVEEVRRPKSVFEGAKPVKPRSTTPEPPKPTITTPRPRRRGVSVEQRNTFFDARIGRQLDRVQDVRSVEAQIGRLQQIAKLIEQRISVTKDVTRRLNLEDRLLDVNRQIAQGRDELAQGLLDGLQLHVDRAQATSGLRDDLQALAALKAGIKQRIREVGATLELRQQLLQVVGQIGQVKQQVGQRIVDALQLQVDRAAGTPGLRDDLQALNALKQGIRQRIREVGSTVELQAQLSQVVGRIGQTKVDIGQEFVQALTLNLDRAQATNVLADDLAALRALRSQTAAQIRETGSTLELQRQLLDFTTRIGDTERQIRERRLSTERAQAQARQFRTLGLSGTGDTPPPTVGALKRQAGQLEKAISGTLLDTTKSRGILTRIRRLFTQNVKGITEDTRRAVQSMLSDLNSQLDGNAKKSTSSFRKANTTKMLQGLGLTPDQVKAVRGRLSQISVAGNVPTPQQGAFGMVVVQHTTTLDGRVIEKSTTKQQQVRARRNPAQKRGYNPRMG